MIYINVITKLSDLFFVMANVMFLRTIVVFPAMLHSNILCGMTARSSLSSCAKFANQDFNHLLKADSTKLMSLSVLIAITPLFIKKTVNTLLFISALIKNVLITYTT